MYVEAAYIEWSNPAYWKGYLKLSLVSCPIALFPATSEREKIRFHQVNKKTGNRIEVDPTSWTETGGSLREGPAC